MYEHRNTENGEIILISPATNLLIQEVSTLTHCLRAVAILEQ